MIQDNSIEAYNIYQSLTKQQNEKVLQQQFVQKPEIPTQYKQLIQSFA